MTSCSFCKGFRQGFFRPADSDPTYLGVLVRCPICVDQTSGQPAGGPNRADALSGSGDTTVAGTTRGAEEPWGGSADGFDRVKQSTGHRRPAEAGVR